MDKCPNCGSKKIHFHRDKEEDMLDGEEEWLCEDCRCVFDRMPY